MKKNLTSCLRKAKRYGVFPALLSLLVACGAHRASGISESEDDDFFDSGKKALQMYLVVTEEPQAMQAPADIKAMWDAVHGQTDAYAPIRRHIKWVPDDYKLDVELDFADLPHQAFPQRRLQKMLRTQSTTVRSLANRAKLAISVRSQAPTLAAGNHIRLVGLAALYIAEKYRGVVFDLLTRRSWSTTEFRHELARRTLAASQVRVVKTRETQGRYSVRTLGFLKFGLPDLVIQTVAEKDLPVVFKIVRSQVPRWLVHGVRVGDRIAPKVHWSPLIPCPKNIQLDGACLMTQVP